MTATSIDSTKPAPADQPKTAEARIGAPAAALAGVASTAAALGASSLVAGLLGAQSVVAAVGGFVIDNQPPGAKDFVVALFGQNDKLALELLIVGVALRIGAGVGLLARWFTAPPPASSPRSRRSGSWRPLATRPWRRRRRRSSPPRVAWPGSRRCPGSSAEPRRLCPPPTEASRSACQIGRGVDSDPLRLGGRGTSRRRRRAGGACSKAPPPPRPPARRRSCRPPSPRCCRRAPTSTSPRITPIVVPNDRFYRIDTALIAPSVDLASWRLTIKGMVDRETVLSYTDWPSCRSSSST